MRRFKVYIETSITGSRCEDEIEVADDATEEDIEAEAREAAFNFINWGYKPVSG